MKYLVVENDYKLSDYLENYLLEIQAKPQILHSVLHRTNEEIIEAFIKSDILIFEPTLITFSQYNLMLMLLYKLITEKKLGIKQIRIFSHNDNLARELKELWSKQTKYLKVVLEKVSVFQVQPASFTTEKLKLL